MLGPIRSGLLEDAAGTPEPSTLYGPVAHDIAGDPAEGHRHPAGGDRVASPAVGDVEALVVGGSGGVLALQV